ncbi:single-stranded DNA binding protein (Ssb) [Carnobacterium maltaromaticum]|uniref:single-stranded DNA-binding protein n=1 Tax=Carnobacterium maltaromaticum TaxID=2751 RepID=UPI00070514BA|nr:single-stranded DNA-binding protein [Carnobacterium maltaromaticum]KRN84200.1 single-stranded DNA binding protein (Ssb) [Carnobacterium maltaromaticum]
MINRVVLVGRLTKDSDLKYTSSGTAVASFTLAVNRQFTNQSGEREADFINCVVWRKQAESLANFTRKGSLIGVEGRLQTRSYDNQQGQRVYVTEVVVDIFSLLESKAANEERQQPQQTNRPANNQASKQQYQQNTLQGTDPFASSGQPIDIDSKDLPF